MIKGLQNTDADYWLRLKQGDPDALGYLYDQYVDKLFATALRKTDDREFAKDVVQEVFIEIWNYRHSITEVQYSFSYLTKVLQGVLLKKLKKENLLSYSELQESIVSPEENIETILIFLDTEKEKRTSLQNALSKLSDRQRQVLELHFVKGLSYDQIAEKLRINYQSVNNLAFRSILRLRSLMYNILF
jgi:RNA polymerase sigma-70 factor (ECF subfamily)